MLNVLKWLQKWIIAAVSRFSPGPRETGFVSFHLRGITAQWGQVLGVVWTGLESPWVRPFSPGRSERPHGGNGHRYSGLRGSEWTNPNYKVKRHWRTSKLSRGCHQWRWGSNHYLHDLSVSSMSGPKTCQGLALYPFHFSHSFCTFLVAFQVMSNWDEAKKNCY